MSQNEPHIEDRPAESYVAIPATVTMQTLAGAPYDGLIDANAALQDWAEERSIRWRRDHGSAWGGRVERYLTDPSAEPDSSRWETELAYLVDDR
jgi:hypothetical protein